MYSIFLFTTNLIYPYYEYVYARELGFPIVFGAILCVLLFHGPWTRNTQHFHSN
jgi:hypothetical protein